MFVRTVAWGLLMSGLAVLGPAPATAADGVDLGLTGFSEMVVDQEHGRIFISEGEGGSVVVVGLDGAPVAELTELEGAQGLWLDPSAARLWVAATEAGAVGEVDTATLAVTVHQTGAASCPHDLATGEGLVWFADECGDGSLAALDPATDQVTTFADAEAERWRLATSPAVPGRLFAVAEGSALLAGFDVTGGTVPTLVGSGEPVETGGADDLAIRPDGRALVLASGEVISTAEFPAWLGTHPETSSVAVARDGRVAGVAPDGWRAFDPHLLNLTAAAPYAEGSWAGEAIRPRGLAWGAATLHAVTMRPSDGRFLLHEVMPKRPTSVSIGTAQTTQPYGANVRLNVSLSGARPGDREVAVYATPQGGRPALVRRVAVPQFRQVTVIARVERATTFTAVYEERADAVGSHDSVTVRVRPAFGFYAEGHKDASDERLTYRVGQRVVFRLEARPVAPGNRLRTKLWVVGYGRRILIGTSDYLRPSDRGVARVYVDGRRDFVGWGLEIRGYWYQTRGAKPRPLGKVDFRFVR
jgi:hypothetical protein